MANRRFDRSPIDILLNGPVIGATAPSSSAPPAVRHDPRVRSDPALLPMTTVRAGTEEYQLFSSAKKKRYSSMAGIGTHTHVHAHTRAVPYTERLPRWVPGRWKWPLEQFLATFLGEVEQSPALLNVGFSWPHSHKWYVGVGLLVVCPVLALVMRMSTSTVLAGLVAGFFHGVFLRARVERKFEWETYGATLLVSTMLVLLTLGVTSTPPSLQGWMARELLWKPLSGLFGLVEWPLFFAVLFWAPFVKDPKCLHVANDQLVVGVLVLTCVYATNVVLPLGLWCGALLKVVRQSIEPATAQGQALGQQQQQQLQQGYGDTMTSPRPAAAAHLQQQQPQPQGQGQGLGTPSSVLSEEARLAAAAAALKYQQDINSHPRRWLYPQGSPYADEYQRPAAGGGGGGYRRSPLDAAGGLGGGGMGASPYAGSASNGRGWGGIGGEEMMDVSERDDDMDVAPPVNSGRYGLRSRQSRRGSGVGGGRAAGATGADFSSSPPPISSPGLRSPEYYGRDRRSFGGGYERMDPY